MLHDAWDAILELFGIVAFAFALSMVAAQLVYLLFLER